MPAVGLVVGFIFEATGITAAVSAAVSGILGAGMIADIATGAIIGAGEGAVSSAIQGGDIAKGALMGAVGGGVGAGAKDLTGFALQGFQPDPNTIGSGFKGAVLGGIPRLAGGVAGGLAGGQSFDQALRGAVPSALGGALSGAARYGFGVDPRTSGDLGSVASSALQTLMAPQPKFNVSAPSQPSTTARPSASLGQSLSIAPSLGYTPGETVFGSQSKDDKAKPRVWNVASLRNVGEAEA